VFRLGRLGSLCRQQQRLRRKSGVSFIGSSFARRLHVEELEDRRMLAVLTVQNNLDDVLPNLVGDGQLSLREAIHIANNPGISIDGFTSIEIEDDIIFDAALSAQTILLAAGQLEITDAVAIDATALAENLTIDAQSLSRVFSIDDPTVTDENFDVTLGGLDLTGGSDLGFGGGVYFLSSGTLTVNQSSIFGNATTTLVMLPQLGGGGIYSMGGDVVVKDSSVSDNSSSNNGGGIYSRTGVVTLENSTVSRNTSNGDTFTGNGGGIYAHAGAVTVMGSNITLNTSIFGGGGGIYSQDGEVTITDSTISENSAGFDGGGIFVRNDGAPVTVTDSNVSSNTSNEAGGGIYTFVAPITITGSTFDANSSRTRGAGISSMGGEVTLNNSHVSGNTTTEGFSPYIVDKPIINGGGGIYTSFSGVSLTNSTITGNSSATHGGGIRASGDVTLIDSTVSQNTSANHGGGIQAGGEVVLMNSKVIENTTSDGDGGGIHALGDSVTLYNSTIRANETNDVPSGVREGDGGGIFAAVDVTLVESTVNGNISTYRGGGIKAGDFTTTSGAVTLTRSTISGNSSDDVGGGIYTFSSEVMLTDSTVSGNTALISGGGIYTRYGGVMLTGSTITANVTEHSSGLGGGIYVRNSSVNPAFDVYNSIVAGNSANSAPDLLHDPGTTLNINYSLIGDTTDSGIVPTTGVANLLDIDPLIGPLADNGGPTQTHALLPGSPVLNSGDPSIPFLATEFDQRGVGYSRVAFDRIDMGAYEAHTTPSADFDRDGNVDGLDFLAWQLGYGKVLAVHTDGNSDDDTDVDASDLAAWEVSYAQPQSLPLAATSGGPYAVGSGQSAVSSAELIDAALSWWQFGKSKKIEVDSADELPQFDAVPSDIVFDSSTLTPQLDAATTKSFAARESDVESAAGESLSEELLELVF